LSLAIGFWHLAYGNWLLASGIWLLALGYWHLVTGIWRTASRFEWLIDYRTLTIELNKRICSGLAFKGSRFRVRNHLQSIES